MKNDHLGTTTMKNEYTGARRKSYLNEVYTKHFTKYFTVHYTIHVDGIAEDSFFSMREKACLRFGSVNVKSAHYRFNRNKLIRF